MRKLTELHALAGGYLSVAKRHQAEYAQMREGAWDQIPGFEKTSRPSERPAVYAERAGELRDATLKIDDKRRPGGMSLKTPVRFQTSEGKERANFKYGLDGFTRQDAQTKLQLAVDEPAVPLASRQLEKGSEVFDGWLKGNIPDDGTLSVHPTEWTRAQVREVLVGAVFSELLGNYDTKTDQWSTKNGHAIDTDLDHATRGLSFRDAEELDRHTVGHHGLPLFPKMPPAANLVYLDYVRGDLELDDADFGAMFDAISRLQSIPAEQFDAVFSQALPDPADRAKLLLRRDALHLEFADFVEDLKAEKQGRQDGTLGLFSRAKLWAQDKQLVALAHFADSGWMERVNHLSQRLAAVFRPPEPVSAAATESPAA